MVGCGFEEEVIEFEERIMKNKKEGKMWNRRWLQAIFHKPVVMTDNDGGDDGDGGGGGEDVVLGSSSSSGKRTDSNCAAEAVADSAVALATIDE